MARDDDILLTAEELRLKARKLRRILVILLLLVLLLVIGAISARPAVHAIKAWQARRHAQKAFAFIEQQKWNDARIEATAAYQLWPGEPEALRAVARFLSRIRQTDALEFWKQLEAKSALTRADLRDEATIALIAGDLERAKSATIRLIDGSGGEPTPHDWLLAAQLAIQQGAGNDVQRYVEHVLKNRDATSREQFQASLLELQIANTGDADNDHKIQADAWQRISQLALGKDDVSLDALMLLARRVFSAGLSDPDEAIINRADLIAAIDNHPLAKAPQKLIALDLQIQEKPDEKNTLIEKAIANWKDGDAPSLAALVAWLNGKGKFSRVAEIVPIEKALQTREVFLQYVDALGALGRWNDIKSLLTGERFPLDPVVVTMYLARCYAQLGEKTASDNNWQRALETAGNDAAKLVMLAEYAEKNGVLNIAESAYVAATVAAPKLRAGWQGRLRLTRAKRDTATLHEILANMQKLWPNDPAIQNDEAYMRLLLMPSRQPQEDRGQTTEDSGSQGANFTAGGREDSANRPREAGDSVMGKSENPKNDEGRMTKDETQVGAIDPNRPESTPNSQELIAIEALAEKLVKQNPSSLPHRTLLSLARLRQGRPDAALEVFKGIQIPRNVASLSDLAVHVAVFAANGNIEAARRDAESIPPNSLLPEEEKLLPTTP